MSQDIPAVDAGMRGKGNIAGFNFAMVVVRRRAKILDSFMIKLTWEDLSAQNPAFLEQDKGGGMRRTPARAKRRLSQTKCNEL